MNAEQTTPTAALLNALRQRALARNAIRAEMRANTKSRLDVSMNQLDGWRALKMAESALNDALLAREISEGVSE